MKNVYFFGDGVAEGNRQQKDLLGGKGANLAEMTNLGIPVPAEIVPDDLIPGAGIFIVLLGMTGIALIA